MIYWVSIKENSALRHKKEAIPSAQAVGPLP